jgi:hypothetical protein
MRQVTTDNLTIIDYEDGSGKLQMFDRQRSHYGYIPRELCRANFAIPIKDITYDYIRKEVDQVYSDPITDDEINELLTKLNK